ncbi:MAG: hypothetical protein JJE30_14850 [Desulfuromonadales bacterium]|nr:hypothetical protein [Desulfuromonadales bacterium]
MNSKEKVLFKLLNPEALRFLTVATFSQAVLAWWFIRVPINTNNQVCDYENR